LEIVQLDLQSKALHLYVRLKSFSKIKISDNTAGLQYKRLMFFNDLKKPKKLQEREKKAKLK